MRIFKMDKNKKVALVKAALRAKAEQKQKEQQEVIKTSDVPTAPTPTERANALKRREASKYTSYIANKLLPGLDK